MFFFSVFLLCPYFPPSIFSESSREMPLHGGQYPVWGWGEAGWRRAEALREVWLQGVFSTRSEPCCDHHLPLYYQSVPRAGSSKGLSTTCFLHWGKDALYVVVMVVVRAVIIFISANPMYKSRFIVEKYTRNKLKVNKWCIPEFCHLLLVLFSHQPLWFKKSGIGYVIVVYFVVFWLLFSTSCLF